MKLQVIENEKDLRYTLKKGETLAVEFKNDVKQFPDRELVHIVR